jgi:hypothetical protein
MAKFPKVLYVKREEDGDDTYFIAVEDTIGHAELKDPVVVGRYILDAEVRLTAQVRVQTVGKGT